MRNLQPWQNEQVHFENTALGHSSNRVVSIQKDIDSFGNPVSLGIAAMIAQTLVPPTPFPL
jgi:hypothetical protein